MAMDFNTFESGNIKDCVSDVGYFGLQNSWEYQLKGGYLRILCGECPLGKGLNELLTRF